MMEPVRSLSTTPAATGRDGALEATADGLTCRSCVPVACMMKVCVLAALTKPAAGPAFVPLASDYVPVIGVGL